MIPAERIERHGAYMFSWDRLLLYDRFGPTLGHGHALGLDWTWAGFDDE